jgi:hypothetical protein
MRTGGHAAMADGEIHQCTLTRLTISALSHILPARAETGPKERLGFLPPDLRLMTREADPR